MQVPTAIDLFAGAGGLSLGLQAAGFLTVAAFERNGDAVSTYRNHVGADHIVAGDVREVDFAHYQGVDLVAGGPPCQPFSTGGLRRGRSDERDLLPEFVRAVTEAQPRAFLLENVPGLATLAHRDYLETMFTPLMSKYRISGPHLVNAADYGVPQSRRRMILVGLRGRDFRIPLSSQQFPVFAGSVLTAQPVGEPNMSKVVFASKPDLRPSPYHGHLFNGGGRPVDLSLPAPTMLASAGGNKTHWIDTLGIVPSYYAHLKRGGKPRFGDVPGARRLTVMECAALQTFPEGMTFAGSRSSGYSQIGNAVPVRLAQAMSEAILEQMRALRSHRRLAVAQGEAMLA